MSNRWLKWHTRDTSVGKHSSHFRLWPGRITGRAASSSVIRVFILAFQQGDRISCSNLSRVDTTSACPPKIRIIPHCIGSHTKWLIGKILHLLRSAIRSAPTSIITIPMYRRSRNILQYGIQQSSHSTSSLLGILFSLGNSHRHIRIIRNPTRSCTPKKRPVFHLLLRSTQCLEQIH